MLGVDLTKKTRFLDVNEKFIQKVLHPDEIIEYQKEDDKPKYIATRWAIKEAIFKSNNEEFSFNKIRIQKIDRTYRFEDYLISTSDEDDYIIAVAMKGVKDED